VRISYLQLAYVMIFAGIKRANEWVFLGKGTASQWAFISQFVRSDCGGIVVIIGNSLK